MINPGLTLARLHVRAQFERQSILYHSARGEIADRYYPKPFPEWELDLKQVRLVSKAEKRRLYLDSAAVGHVADIPANPEELLEGLATIIGEVTDRLGVAALKRIGLRPVFATERVSFEELFGSFRSNVVRHESSWIQNTRFKVTDVGIMSVIYGAPEDGMLLTTGVLTPQQAFDLKASEKFEYAEDELVIEAGTLMIDIDRYQLGVKPSEVQGFFEREYKAVMDFAGKIRINVLR
jgi:hypothetical protein